MLNVYCNCYSIYISSFLLSCFVILEDQGLPEEVFVKLPNAKIRVSPDASQRNIGGVGPSGVGAGVGHVYFIFFV